MSKLSLAARHELWRRGELSWKLHSGQREIANIVDTMAHSEMLLLCARQWGKSYFSIYLALRECLLHPGSIVRICGPSLKQVHDIVNDNLEPFCEDAPPGLIERMKASHRWKVGESSLRLGILERAHSNSMRGGNARLIITEEGGFVLSDDYRHAERSIIGPQLLRSGGKLVRVTSVSEDPEHYIHTDVIPLCQETGTFFSRDVYTNPQLTPAQIEQAMRIAGGEGSEDWQREYLNKIIRSTTLVCVPEYDDARCVAEPAEGLWFNYLASTDVGGVRDKTVSLHLAYDFSNDVDWVLDERMFEPNTSSSTIIPEIKTFEASRQVADGAGQTLVDWGTDHDYYAQLPPKDDWRAGINQIRRRIIQGKLKIHPRCEFLRKTLKGAVFNRERTDLARTKLLGHMDALMALSYGIRCLDRVTNPVPPKHYHGDRWLRIVRESNETNENTSLVKLIT